MLKKLFTSLHLVTLFLLIFFSLHYLMDLGSKCGEWIDLLNIKTWDEFVYYSTNYTIHSMMSTLTVPVHFQHYRDLRLIFAFGIFCQSLHHSTYPILQNHKCWIYKFIGVLHLIGSVSQIMRKLATFSWLPEILHWLHTQSSLSIHALRYPHHHHPSWTLILHPLALIHRLFHLHHFKSLLLKMFAVMGGY